MHQIKAAAEAKDGDRFNQFVDYPKLHESVKGQLSAKFAISRRFGHCSVAKSNTREKN